MPIPSPGTYDQASQATLLVVKAKTDLIGGDYIYLQLLPRRGNAVQGIWTWEVNAQATEWLTDRKLDVAGYWWNFGTFAVNDEYAFPIFLPAGAYSVEIIYVKAVNAGILSLRLGAVVLGTVDMYSASPTFNNITVFEFTVAADTVANLRMVIATKNAAATAYGLYMQRATLWRRT